MSNYSAFCVQWVKGWSNLPEAVTTYKRSSQGWEKNSVTKYSMEAV